MQISSKYLISIPKDIVILYSTKKKIITIIGITKIKSLKLELKLRIELDKNVINVTPIPFSDISRSNKKKIKALRGTIVANIKQIILETSSLLYKKLKFVGVGYRAFEVENFKNQIFMLKLGYSHPIYFKKPLNTEIFCLKLTKLFIFGNSYQDITKTSSTIRSFKSPEPYKGKGILYDNEKIQLKEGKKI
jgi:large subunit ribosomal protein L6